MYYILLNKRNDTKIKKKEDFYAKTKTIVYYNLRQWNAFILTKQTITVSSEKWIFRLMSECAMIELGI